jgi:hypothetical protein
MEWPPFISPVAVLDDGSGRLRLGREANRAVFAELVATGREFENLISEINARPSSAETWHSLPRAVPTAA